MAIYHCSIKIIGRSTGRTSVGASAYRSGEKLYNEYDGLTHDYTKKTGVAHTEIIAPDHAQDWAKDRERLWNEVEKVEKGKKAQLSREVEVALPVELNQQQQIELIRDYVKENFVAKGMVADISIHDKEDGNPHAHLMLTMRPFELDGKWGAKQKKKYILDEQGNKQYNAKTKTYKCTTEKTTNWDSKETLEKWRENWATTTNKHLKRVGSNERIDHRSYEEQGINKAAQIHEGHIARAIENRGENSDKGNKNREIRENNQKLELLNKQIAFMEKELNREKQELEKIMQNADLKGRHEEIKGVISEINELELSLQETKGIFKGKQRKALKEQIDEQYNSLGKMRYDLKQTYGISIKEIDNKINELKKELEPKKEDIFISFRRIEPTPKKEITWQGEIYLALDKVSRHSTSRDELENKMEQLGFKLEWNKNYIEVTNPDGNKIKNTELYPPEKFAPRKFEEQFDYNADKKDFINAITSWSYKSYSKEEFINGMEKSGFMVDFDIKNNKLKCLSPKGNEFSNKALPYNKEEYTARKVENRFKRNREIKKLYSDIAKCSYKTNSLEEYKNEMKKLGYEVVALEKRMSYRTPQGEVCKDNERFFPENLKKSAIEERIANKVKSPVEYKNVLEKNNSVNMITQSWQDLMSAVDFLSKENQNGKPLSTIGELEGQALKEWIDKQKSKSRYEKNRQRNWEHEM